MVLVELCLTRVPSRASAAISGLFSAPIAQTASFKHLLKLSNVLPKILSPPSHNPKSSPQAHYYDG